MKSILIYNWAQFDNPNMDGGGVSVYIKNIIDTLIKKDVRVFFLSSGFSYTGLSDKPFIEQTDNMFSKDGVQSFRVVNSPIKAPAHDSFGDLYNAREDKQIAEIFLSFMGNHGPFDEVHFHNVEGISTVLFSLIKQKTNAKIAYWLHNYHSICPQIELFKEGRYLCEDYHDGVDCVSCLHYIPPKNDRIAARAKSRMRGNDNIVVLHNPFENILSVSIKKALKLVIAPIYLLFNAIKKVVVYFKRGGRKFSIWLRGFKLGNIVYRRYRKIRKVVRIALGLPLGRNKKNKKQALVKNSQSSNMNWSERMEEKSNELKSISGLIPFYREWREINVVRMNHDVDFLYAVSEQVKERFVERGVFPDKIKVTPLGMDIYHTPDSRIASYLEKPKSSVLRVGYFGYAITSKGLSFLIDSIQSIEDKAVLANIELKIHCRIDDFLMRKLSRLSPLLADVKVLNGYNRDEIFDIAKNLDIVVVPSIWWETYNQVAYEMMMLGTPVMVSDTVGIKYAIPDEFIFESNNQQSLAKKIEFFATNRSALGKFWDKSAKSHYSLPSMEEHLDMVLDERF